MRLLRRGSRGPDVAEVQRQLSELGYVVGPIDGIFGVRTEAAVIRFQRDRGLVPDGIVGPLTYNALFQTSQVILHTIVAGDTFYKLALNYGVTVEQIMAANPGVNPNNLQIGQVIRIPRGAGKRHTFSAWIPYWTQQTSMEVVGQHAQLITTISPFWYELTTTGELSPFPNAEDASVIQFAKSQGIEIIPLITNNFDPQLVSNMVNNPVIRQRHITDIVNKVRTMNYDGIEIDYENLLARDAQAFVQFLRELKNALAPYNKKLYIAVQAKTGPTQAGGSAGHDYPGIGSAVDVVRLMIYDYSWDSPGPIAPANWVRQVLDYAVSVIPRSKIEAGLPTYGYDWGVSRRGITYVQAINLVQQYGAQIIQDSQRGPHFSYRDSNGINHQVWFTNAVNFATYVDIVNQYNVKGIAIWYPGGDDPQIYTLIQNRLE